MRKGLVQRLGVGGWGQSTIKGRDWAMLMLQVYLPLLLEYFSESELRELTHHVLELHGIPESGVKVQEEGQNHYPLLKLTN